MQQQQQEILLPETEISIHDAKSVAVANSAARRRVCRGCKDHLVQQAREKEESKLHRSSSGSSMSAGKNDSSESAAVNVENSPNGSPTIFTNTNKSLQVETTTSTTPLQERTITFAAPTATSNEGCNLNTSLSGMKTINTPASNGSFERIWDEDLSTHYTTFSEQLTSPLVRSTMRAAMEAEGGMNELSATPASSSNRSPPFVDMSSILFGVPLLEEEEDDEDEYDDNDDGDDCENMLAFPLNFTSPSSDTNTNINPTTTLDEANAKDSFNNHTNEIVNPVLVDQVTTSGSNEEDGIATPVRTRVLRPQAVESVNGNDIMNESLPATSANIRAPDLPTRGSVYTFKAPKLVISGAPGSGTVSSFVLFIYYYY